MKKETAELLSSFNDDIEIHEDYSGRGMFGQQTSAVTCDGVSNIFGSLSTALSYGEDISDALSDLENIRMDNFGMDMIFY